MPEKDIMFSLIYSEISETQLDLDMFRDMSADVYKQLYVLSKNHDMAHIVASALSRVGLLKDDEISAKFNKQLMLALYRDGQREYALEQLGATLENAKIPHIMLKGAVIRKIYPKSWMRTSCDVDVLVRQEDSEMAIDALCQAGYERLDDCSTHDYNFSSPNKIHIELHYTLTQEGQFSSSDGILEEVWDKHSILTDGYNYRYELTPEAFIIYHLAHMGRHLVHGGCGIRPFIDLWLIKKRMSFDGDKLYSLLDRSNLVPFFEASVQLGEVWLETNKHNEITERLENYILSGGVYGNTDNAAKVKAAKKIGKVRLLMSIMFLPKKNLQVMYPILEKYPILFPFCQVMRWFNVFNKKKRQKVKNLVDARNSVSEAEADSTLALLTSLGIDQT